MKIFYKFARGVFPGGKDATSFMKYSNEVKDYIKLKEIAYNILKINDRRLEFCFKHQRMTEKVLKYDGESICKQII